MEELVRRRDQRLTFLGRASQWLSDHPSWGAAIRWAAVWAIGLRVALGLIMAAAWLVVRPYELPAYQSLHGYGYLPLYTDPLGEYLLGVWMRWDAVHYINLAIAGYFGNIPGDTVFYPLYFLLIRFISQGLHADMVVVGLSITTVSIFTALVFLYRITETFYGERAARWSVIAMAIYPTSFFLYAPYTESLFLALTLAAFWYAYQARWSWVAGLGALASLSRGPGIYTSGALAWIAYTQLGPLKQIVKNLSWRRWAPVLIGLGLPVLAGLGFLAWKTWVGYPSLLVVYRDYTHWVLSDPFTSIYRAIAACFLKPDMLAILEATSMLLFLGFTVLLIAHQLFRRVEWALFALLNMGVFLSRYSLNFTPLGSMARYVLVVFPAFIILGVWLSRRGSKVQFCYCIFSSVLLILFTCLYTAGWFIG